LIDSTGIKEKEQARAKKFISIAWESCLWPEPKLFTFAVQKKRKEAVYFFWGKIQESLNLSLLKYYFLTCTYHFPTIFLFCISFGYFLHNHWFLSQASEATFIPPHVSNSTANEDTLFLFWTWRLSTNFSLGF
jgi:hypothetical protein